MPDATLGHPEAFGEYLLSDFEFTHLGLDQFNPFIHVRHRYVAGSSHQNTNCSI